MPRTTDEPIQQAAISRKRLGGEAPIVVAEITDRALYSGFFGGLDSARMAAIVEKILDILGKTGIEIILIDLSNVDILDSAAAAHLVRLGTANKLIGVETIFCGIRPLIAQSMAVVGIELEKFRISRDLKSALKEVFLRQGMMLIPFSPSPAAQAQQQQQQQQ